MTRICVFVLCFGGIFLVCFDLNCVASDIMEIFVSEFRD